MARPAVAAYPWDGVESVGRQAERAASTARRRLARAVVWEHLARETGRVLAADVELLVHDITGGSASGSRAAEVCLELCDGSVRVILRPEPELAAAMLGRVLSRPVPLASPAAPLGAELRGALAAIAVEIARSAGKSPAFRVLSEAPSRVADVSIRATLLLDGRPYEIVAEVELSEAPGTTFEPEPSLALLGELEVALPVVVALSQASREDLGTLIVGAAWMPGGGWWIAASGAGRAVLAAPGSEQGVAVDLADDGRIVLRGEPVSLAAEVDVADADEKLSREVLDAPVVVRVELGHVSMSAREWAKLRVGDVIASGRRVAEPVVLRIAGREVARGDLVSIEGELGVRIRELIGEGGGE